MPIAMEEGNKGLGHTGYTKYEAKNKPVGREVNDSLHNGHVSATEKITEAPKQGSYTRGKGE